jgi:hypothetical protein
MIRQRNFNESSRADSGAQLEKKNFKVNHEHFKIEKQKIANFPYQL